MLSAVRKQKAWSLKTKISSLADYFLSKPFNSEDTALLIIEILGARFLAIQKKSVVFLDGSPIRTLSCVISCTKADPGSHHRLSSLCEKEDFKLDLHDRASFNSNYRRLRCCPTVIQSFSTLLVYASSVILGALWFLGRKPHKNFIVCYLCTKANSGSIKTKLSSPADWFGELSWTFTDRASFKSKYRWLGCSRPVFLTDFFAKFHKSCLSADAFDLFLWLDRASIQMDCLCLWWCTIMSTCALFFSTELRGPIRILTSDMSPRYKIRPRAPRNQALFLGLFRVETSCFVESVYKPSFEIKKHCGTCFSIECEVQ